jgi:hypothetical protein
MAMTKTFKVLNATPVVVSRSRYRNSAKVMCVGVVIEYWSREVLE